MRNTLPLLICASLAAATAGCLGNIGALGKGGGENGSPSAPGEEPSTPPESTDFEVQSDQPSLLPFPVRIGRVAAVVGVPTDDPIFATLQKNKTALGHHDFANGFQPDRLWSASRMALWVKSLKPVCASKAMRDRYPSLPKDLGALIENAYGRPATDEDHAAMKDAVVGLSEAAAYQMICLSVLSSAEFVVQ